MSQEKWIHNLQEVLSQVESDAEANQKVLRSSQAKADNILAIFFLFIALVGLLNLYFVYEWTEEAKDMIHEMELIHNNVEDLTDTMDNLYVSMQDINDRTRLVPIIDEEMTAFVGSMAQMTNRTIEMRNSLTSVNHSMGGVNHDLKDMNQRFDHLNKSVQHLGRNVGEMSDLMP